MATKKTTKTMYNKNCDYKRYKELISELNNRVEQMSDIDNEIEELQEMQEGEAAGDTEVFRKLLTRQIDLLELMRSSLDLVDEARAIKTSKEEPKHSRLPSEIADILGPIFQALGIDEDDIGEFKFINLSDGPEPPKKCCKKKKK